METSPVGERVFTGGTEYRFVERRTLVESNTEDVRVTMGDRTEEVYT